MVMVLTVIGTVATGMVKETVIELAAKQAADWIRIPFRARRMQGQLLLASSPRLRGIRSTRTGHQERPFGNNHQKLVKHPLATRHLRNRAREEIRSRKRMRAAALGISDYPVVGYRCGSRKKSHKRHSGTPGKVAAKCSLCSPRRNTAGAVYPGTRARPSVRQYSTRPSFYLAAPETRSRSGGEA